MIGILAKVAEMAEISAFPQAQFIGCQALNFSWGLVVTKCHSMMNTSFAKIEKMEASSLKVKEHCKRHNGPEFILQVLTQILIQFHHQNLE